jgi:phenylacetate-CoA ligase
MLLCHSYVQQVLQAAQQEQQELEQICFAPDRIAAIQAKKLEQLWKRAITTPYYQHLKCTTPDKLNSLPVTPKSAVKQQSELFLAQGGRYAKYYESSGTSGIPTPTPRLPEDIVWNTVSISTCWKHILSQEDRVATLLPSDISPVGDLISNLCEYLGICFVRCYPFALGMCDWNRLEQMFLRYQPTSLFVAPGVLVQFMRVLKQRGSFESIKGSIQKIMLLGEVSTVGLRQMLSANWKAKVYDASYGSTETGTIAAACEDGLLHTLVHSFILELDNGEKIVPLQPGVQGELIVTTLNNYARPLLRYAMGDLVEVVDNISSSEALQLPTLKVLGRKEEQINVHGVALDVETLESLIYNIPGITGYIIEMNRSGSIAKLLLEKDIDFPSEAEVRVLESLKQTFETKNLKWDSLVLVNQLPSITKSGAGQKNWKKTNLRMVA